MNDETTQDPQSDSISLPVAEFVQRMVDMMAGLNSRVISLERQYAEGRLERDAMEARFNLLMRAQQDEIELLARLNSEAFAKIATVLFDLGVPKTVIKAALPPKTEMN